MLTLRNANPDELQRARVRGNYSKATKKPYRDIIYDLMAGRQMTPTMISEETGIRRTVVITNLNTLRRAGRVCFLDDEHCDSEDERVYVHGFNSNQVVLRSLKPKQASSPRTKSGSGVIAGSCYHRGSRWGERFS